MDDLEELHWERPTRLPCQANASVNTDHRALEPRPEQARVERWARRLLSAGIDRGLTLVPDRG